MISKRTRAIVSALVAGCVLAACGDPAPAPGADGAAAKPVPKPADLPPEMVAAVSAGKSSSVISVHFALQATPTINQGLPIDIAIVPHEKFGAVRAHFDGQEDLPVTSGEEFGPAREPAKDKALVHQLVLLPRREGVFVITMSVDSEDTHGSTTRIYSIPVIVGAAAAPPIPAESPAPAPVPAATG